ncbi:nucleotide sugar dehydrogenase [Flaviflagellibacter deserti]|uniref:UDP-glucose 6-dehydrogenase n=1 Tax=Flaviflagellibacter deserti TaxID=2267266 RepID=A0ABV9Z0T0_9HYPH
MDISVFGIGYVGAVSAACLSRDGNKVIAADVNREKVDGLNAGVSPIVEPGLDELIRGGVANGSLSATGDTEQAVRESDLSFVCVGTPSAPNGSLDISYLVNVTEHLGSAIRKKNSHHSVVYRSTMLPGTMDSIIIPKLEAASGKKAGDGFGIAYYPEFLRESTAIKDYDNPGTIVFGKRDELTFDKLLEIHKKIPVSPIAVDIRAAEAIKYTNNAWHALKISFANEIGNICKAAGIDGHTIMSVLCADHRLNISPAYLKPGFAFGGSCLPKDLRALRYKARQLEVPTPILDATLAANEVQLARAYQMIAATGSRRIGMVGLSFKSGTDDLRESPFVELCEMLYGRGYDVRIYDPNIQIGKLTGANYQYIRSRLPHLASLLTTQIDDVVDHAEVLVLGNADVSREVLKRVDDDRLVIDLVRVDQGMASNERYQGICW